MSLKKLIRDEMDRTDDRDPGVIANRIAMRLSAKEARALLAETLRSAVRVEMGVMRMDSRRSSTAGPSKWSDPGTQSILANGIFVGAEMEYKTHSDLTAEDCDWIAEDREHRAGALMTVALEYRGYAAAIRKAGVSTLGELSEQDVAVAA